MGQVLSREKPFGVPTLSDRRKATRPTAPAQAVRRPRTAAFRRLVDEPDLGPRLGNRTQRHRVVDGRVMEVREAKVLCELMGEERYVAAGGPGWGGEETAPFPVGRQPSAIAIPDYPRRGYCGR